MGVFNKKISSSLKVHFPAFRKVEILLHDQTLCEDTQQLSKKYILKALYNTQGQNIL